MSLVDDRRDDARDANLALATRAADAADYARVIELYEAAGPISPRDRMIWALLLREAGALDRAAALAGRASPDLPHDPGSADSPDSRTDDAAWIEFDPGEPPSDGPAVPNHAVRAFVRWFGGRRDVHARQWWDARRDRGGYFPRRQPIDEHVASQHLQGTVTLGQYVLHPDESVSFAVLDLDPTGVPEAEARLMDEGSVVPEPVREYARAVLRAALAAGIHATAEETGGDGLHVWVFFAPRVAAAEARALARELALRAGPQPAGVSIEIFPKQDHLRGKGLGNLVKLPLGLHQKTLRRSRILDADLRAIEDPATALESLQPASPEAVASVLTRRVVPLAEVSTDLVAVLPLPVPAGPSPRALAEALATVASADAGAAADRVLAGCRILGALATKACEERSLAPEEARALLYTVGLVGRQNDRIETLFAQAGVSRKELDRVRRGLQAPMGCARLREHFGALGRCVCPEAPPGGYPTPALFVLRMKLGTARSERFSVESLEPSAEASPHGLEARLSRIELMLTALVRGSYGGAGSS